VHVADPETVPSNLPRPLSSFIGRDEEVRRLVDACAGTALLTLTGPGGAGKTRLAREVAAQLAAAAPARHPDGVWWVELAPLAPGGDASALLQLVADVVGVHLTVTCDAADAVARALAGRRALLVLDNCEHVVDAAAALAERLLRGCPGLTILATSREALGAEGEVAWQVPPLARPPVFDAAHPATADALRAYDAVQLFVERARAAQPAFALTDANASAVTAICTRLDGLPLAIELAAATLPSLGVEQLATRLDDALRLLTRGRRTALPRHRTLRAVLDWSHDLLAPDERVLLARLSVFRGAFSLDAAEAVGDVLPDGTPVLDALGGLVEHSLVEMREGSADAADGAPDEPRYALLETVRQYGAARLRESDEEEHGARRRHATWIAAFTEAVEPRFWSPARGRMVAAVRRDLDDVRAALSWASAPSGDAVVAAQIAGALGWFWATAHAWDEGRACLDGAIAAAERERLDAPAQPPLVRLYLLRAYMFGGGLANYVGDAAGALSYVDRMAPLLDGLAHDVEARAAALDPAADPARAAEVHAWTRMLRRALPAAEDARAETMLRLGDATAALAHAEAGARHAVGMEDRWYAALLRTRRAIILAAAGRRADAAAEFAQAAAEQRALDESWILSYCLQGMAVNALAMGHLHEAAARAAEGAAVLRAEPDPWFLSRALETLAATCVAPWPDEPAGAHRFAPLAAQLLGAAESLRRRCGAALLDADRAMHASTRDAVTRGMDAGDRAREEASGAARTYDEMIALAETVAAALVAPPSASSRGMPSAQAASDHGAATAASTAPRGPALAIDVLGTFAIRRDGLPLPDDELPSGKVRELLLWLLLHPGAAKEQIGAELWPDASSAQLRSSFHFTLHHLRRALGDPRWVTFGASGYRLDRAPASDRLLDADVDAVLGAAATLRDLSRARSAPTDDALDDAREALARYHGDVATTTGIGSVAGDWLADRQAHVRAAWVDGSTQLAAMYGAAGRHADALAIYERVLAVEPLRESVHRALMQTHLALGEPARALGHYDALVALLRREVGASPARETSALVASLRRG
jgi:predicted ATPase/DNA-binding SARP family transcriptional activator